MIKLFSAGYACFFFEQPHRSNSILIILIFPRNLPQLKLLQMSIEIKVPTVGESINEVTLVKWHKNDGDWVNRDEVIAELESEKATFELNAEQAGVVKIIAKEGDTLNIGDVVCSIDTEAAKP